MSVASAQDADPCIDEQEFGGEIDQIVTEETIERGSAASSAGQRNRRETSHFSEGSVVQQVRVFDDDDVQSYSEYSYDDHGRVVAWNGYDGNDRRLWRNRKCPTRRLPATTVTNGQTDASVYYRFGRAGWLTAYCATQGGGARYPLRGRDRRSMRSIFGRSFLRLAFSHFVVVRTSLSIR